MNRVGFGVARQLLTRVDVVLHRSLLLPIVICLAAAPAWALKPAEHRKLAEAACAAERLPDAFCRRMGKAVYETDYSEWDLLAAHAQRERSQSRCAAADAAAMRVDQLARAMVDHVRAAAFEDGAIELGRALHTLQDECAHHGITNEEHAYYSLDQACTGDQVSPDVQPAAIACAQSRTADAMHRVAVALADAHWNSVDIICRDADQRDVCANAVLPTPAMACKFLGLYGDWDGSDSGWNGELVGPALVDAFAAALAGEPASRSICGGDAAAIDPVSPHAKVAVTNITCALTDVGCLGKVDEGGSEPTTAGGCAATGTPGLMLGLAVCAAAALARRRSPRRCDRDRDRASRSRCP